MVTFVGAEYIIANSLIAINKMKNRTEITLAELSDCGLQLQKKSVTHDLNVVFLSSEDQFTNAIYNYSDYFEYYNEKKLVGIKQSKRVADLQSRFYGYLPFDVLSFLFNTTNEFVRGLSDE